MSWKEVGRLALLLLAVNLIGAGLGAAWEWVALGVFLLVVVLASWLSGRSWTARMERLRQSTPDEQERELASLPSEDRIAARLTLGHVGSQDARVDPESGETFTYPATPRSLRWSLVAACLFMSGLPTVLLLLDRVAPGQEMWAMLLGVAFALGVLVLPSSWAYEDTKVRITASGIQELRPDGRRVGILWSEVAWVRNRRWMTALEVYSADGRRRIRIWYKLEGFARMMELLTAHLMWAEERFRRSSADLPDETGDIGASE